MGTPSRPGRSGFADPHPPQMIRRRLLIGNSGMNQTWATALSHTRRWSVTAPHVRHGALKNPIGWRLWRGAETRSTGPVSPRRGGGVPVFPPPLRVVWEPDIGRVAGAGDAPPPPPPPNPQT